VTAPQTQRRRYDHRFVDLVCESGDIGIALKLGVPRSTAATWLRRPRKPVLTLEQPVPVTDALGREVADLRRRVAALTVLLRVLFAVFPGFGVHLAGRRLPEGDSKLSIVGAIVKAQEVMPLRKILHPIGLSQSRFHAWKRTAARCGLEDQSTCPKTSPQQLLPEEARTIRDMVVSEEYRHVPTGTLAMLAQRSGRVFASATTWYRLARENGWRRPRRRVHPEKPTVGIRAQAPDEIWHIDTTIIRLVSGVHAYLHAVIDNFSQKILAWKLAEKFDPMTTVTILLQAAGISCGTAGTPTVITDAGVENCNRHVDALVDQGLLRRVVARTDLRFSNSMIEAFWRTLKHQWLYLHTLDSVRSIEPLVAFYVTEHNSKLPHSAFRGQTPDEMYLGTGAGVPQELEARRSAARKARLEQNRARVCPACAMPDPAAAGAA
jgi:putative transposase